MLQFSQSIGDSGLALHSLQQLLAGQFVPGGSDQRRISIMLTQQLDCGIQLRLRDRISPGQDDGRSRGDLIIVELTEVLHIDFHLTGISHRHRITEDDILPGHLLHSSHHIGQLAHAGGLDDHTVRMILRDHLLQGPAKIAHQGAADTAGIHLRDIDASILQKPAIDADLTELVLDQHQLLALIPLLDHLLDQRRLTGAQEATINVYLCHDLHLCVKFLSYDYTTSSYPIQGPFPH